MVERIHLNNIQSHTEINVFILISNYIINLTQNSVSAWVIYLGIIKVQMDIVQNIHLEYVAIVSIWTEYER